MPLNNSVSLFSASRVFVLYAFIFFQSGAVQAAIPASERAALIALYNSTDGANWTENSSWLGAVGAECSWYGITCANDEYISSIRLYANNLLGPIPSELSKLSKLYYLQLGGNQLIGSIPTELYQLSNLQYLYLSSNQLTGSIPIELGQLSILRGLDLSVNQLTGNIPTELGQLSQLHRLDLGSNQLTGSIPSELSQLSQLDWLRLVSNQLTGSIPSELGQLNQLKNLIFGSNQLTGSIPVELGQLSQLTNLSLHHNQLTGKIPAELSQLSQLKDLVLNENQLTGSIPKELGQLSQLKYLFLTSNQLTGSLPIELGKLSQLEFLLLDSNHLTGSIPSELGQLGQLYRLNLDFNQLTGSIPSELGQLSQLEYLFLHSNYLKGGIPAELGQLSIIKSLNLANNQIDFVPHVLTQLIELNDFSISSNCLTETTLAPAVITFLTQKDPNWQVQNNNCSAPPPSSPPPVIINEGISGLNFKVVLTEPLPAGYGVFINFDNQQGDWFNQEDAGGHIALQHQGGNIYSTERILDKPGLRSVRAGIFELNNQNDNTDDRLVGDYSAGSSCTEKVCLDAIPRENSYGNPGSTGSGSQLFKNVDVANGNYHLSSIDISVSGKGPSFSFSRAYNSLADKPWSFGYEMKASFFNDIDIDGTTVLSADRRMVIGPREDGSLLYYFKDLDGRWYTFTPGNFNQLIENPDNSFTLFTQGNRLYRFTNPAGSKAGRLQSIEDRLGNALTLNYDASNDLTGATDANGRSYTILRDGNNRIKRVTDFSDRFVEYTYDDNGMIIDVRNMRGGYDSYTYAGTSGDEAYQLKTITDPRNNIQMTIIYNADNRVDMLTDGVGNETGFRYGTVYQGGPIGTGIVQPSVDGENHNRVYVLDDDRTHVEEIVDAITYGQRFGTNDIRTRQEYLSITSRQQLAEKSLVKRITDPKNNDTTIAYSDDAKGRPNSILSAENEETKATYATFMADVRQANLSSFATTERPFKTGVPALTQYQEHTITGKAQKITDPLGAISQRVFDNPAELLTQSINPRHYRTSYSYDEFSNVKTITDAKNGLLKRDYDNLGRVEKETSALGLMTSYTYDEHGNVRTETEQATDIDYTTKYDYDKSDNLIKTTDQKGQVTNYVYDTLNRKKEENYLVGGVLHTRKYAYDAMGRLKRVTNERDQTSATHYDSRSQVKSKVDALGNTTVSYTYDANGNVGTVTDGEGRKVTTTYDKVNRRTQVTDDKNQTQKWTYNIAGQVETYTDTRGEVTQYEYDALGSLKKMFYPEHPELGFTESSYDENSNVSEVIDPKGHKTTYIYDELDRRTETILHDGQKWEYTYDANGNQLTEKTPTGEQTVQVYDALNRVKRLTEYAANNSIARQIDYDYDANSNVTRERSGGSVISYSYDEINRISSITDVYGKTIRYAYDKAGNRTELTYPGNKTIHYAYDKADRLKSLTDWLNKTTTYERYKTGQTKDVFNGNGTKTQYRYDAVGRLILLKNLKANGSVISQHDLTLDKAGNITQASVNLPLSPMLPQSIASMNYGSNNRLQSADGNSYTHDRSGRIIKEDQNSVQTIFNFDINDHISTITRNGTTLSSYAYDLNNNRIKQVQNGVETRYVIDPLANLPNVVAETDASGNVSRYYLYGDGLVSQIDAARESHYYHFDPTGHTLALSDASGNVSDKYAYAPYGYTTVEGATPNPFRYVGQHGVMDDGNGLHYMRARYYSEEIKRFVSLDGLHGDMVNAQALNRYAYVLGNPVSFIDANGYQAYDWKYKLSYGWKKLANHSSEIKLATDVAGLRISEEIKVTVEHKETQVYKKIKIRPSFAPYAKKKTAYILKEIITDIEIEGKLSIKIKASKFIGIAGTILNLGLTSQKILDACTTSKQDCFITSTSEAGSMVGGSVGGLLCIGGHLPGIIVCSYIGGQVVGKLSAYASIRILESETINEYARQYNAYDNYFSIDPSAAVCSLRQGFGYRCY